FETHDRAWDRLVKAAVHPAIYNAEPRALSPCLEGTRTTVLKSIWQVVDEKSQKNIWLHEFPGSGKTSILFTIAEELRAQGRLAGPFFFSRDNVDKTMCDHVVPTLTYQLALAFPSVKDDIIRTIIDDPALLSHLKSRKDQIQRLIIKHLWRPQSRSPVTFIIDALDESCSPDDAIRVAHLLTEAICAYKDPLDAHVILASRLNFKLQISEVYGKGFRNIQEITLQNYDEETKTNIRHFLAHEFQRVVETRNLSLGDVTQWPSSCQMDDLTNKVGDSFLCASIAMKYISHPKKHPVSRLDAFLSSSPHIMADAYADLDYVYQNIIRDNRALVRCLIDIINLAQPLPRSQLLQFFPPDYSKSLDLTLEEFSSILTVSSDKPMVPIQSYHSSLFEFFENPVRCHPYYTDSTEIHRGLGHQCFIILHKLKANLCDISISDRTVMAAEDIFEHKRDTALPDIMRYACRHWAHHLSLAKYNEHLVSASKQFLHVHILHWIEALCLLGELNNGLTMLQKARSVFSGWAKIKPHPDFTPMNKSLATAEQLIILYFDPINLFPLQIYYIVEALADLSGKPLNLSSNVLVHRCGTVSDSPYQFPVSELQSSLVKPGVSQGQPVEGADSKVLGVLADCCHWLPNSELGLTLDLKLSAFDIQRIRRDGPIQTHRPWVCLELTSEHSKQVSPIQRINGLFTSGDTALELRMYNQHESPLAALGSLCFSISPTPAFGPSERGQIPAQPKKSGGGSGEGSQGPGLQRGLPSVLDLDLTFKEPDECGKVELTVRQISSVFHALNGGLLSVFAKHTLHT
ncbi:hypothetical protein BDR07DRAFT_1390750, partial [Suillus spraguei]